jgi:hypothetical protein
MQTAGILCLLVLDFLVSFRQITGISIYICFNFQVTLCDTEPLDQLQGRSTAVSRDSQLSDNSSYYQICTVARMWYSHMLGLQPQHRAKAATGHRTTAMRPCTIQSATQHLSSSAGTYKLGRKASRSQRCIHLVTNRQSGSDASRSEGGALSPHFLQHRRDLAGVSSHRDPCPVKLAAPSPTPIPAQVRG